MIADDAWDVFLDFDRDNPQVYDELVAMTRKAVAAGATKLGMKQMFEVLRWNNQFKTNAPDYKLNNNYTSFYSRLIMDHHPEFEGLFETRTAKADEE